MVSTAVVSLLDSYLKEERSLGASTHEICARMLQSKPNQITGW